MQPAHVATIRFQDVMTGQEAAAIIRAEQGQLLLCLTLKEDGDIEVGFGTQDSAKLFSAFQSALAIVQAQSNAGPASV
jgi:hypothetical protein